MPDIMTYIMQPYSEDPDKLERILQLGDWDQNDTSVKAIKEGVMLTYEHWAVVDYLQKYFLEHGWPNTAKDMVRVLDEEFSEQGGRKFLYQLFPASPIKQATRIAGLPPIPEPGARAHGYEV